jgi:hypothetical protein
MAIKESSLFLNAMEAIVSEPRRATIAVGSSIIILLLFIEKLALIFPGAIHIKWIIPFIPPLFITRTAKRINQRSAEHDFIRDAEPYIFVAYPKKATVEHLMNTKPEILSDSSERHLGIPVEKLFNMNVLPEPCLENKDFKKELVEILVKNFHENNGYGVIRNFSVSLKAHGENGATPYIASSVLKITSNNNIKWQATLMRI